MDSSSPVKVAGDLLSLPVRNLLRAFPKKPGAAPGTLVYTGPERSEPVAVHLIEYDEEDLEERALRTDASFQEFAANDRLTWINVDGLDDLDLTRAIGSAFQLHPLVQEDLVHTGQRPKVEEYDDYFFVVLRMLTLDTATSSVKNEQIGIVFGKGYVLSFQERAGDVWQGVRDRIRGKSGRIRTRGADYLAYALIDAIVDNYFNILEFFAEQVELLEEEVLESPTQDTMHRIHKLRQEMFVVRRAVWPLRELANALVRTESPLVDEGTGVFLRDVYDHTVQVVDAAETLREVVSGLMDLYLSSVSNRMNEIMKVLTIMASIFIPLTFLAGIYGMNFERMPELGIPWAYPALLGIMGVMALGLLIFFKRRDWL
ncbi:MAG: magnesium/cobalt transporter CorA [Gemmatimonadetes bacterium]|nr:magnesium/cobalt transporter CorA [Gemmatimonadota bacterium]